MKKALLYAFVLAGLMISCQPEPIAQEDLTTGYVQDLKLEAGARLYTLNEFVDAFMTEEGNFKDSEHPYRSRANSGNDLWLFSIDTIPADGPGIYIRGRVVTEDIAGNFYKSMVIQEIVDGEQQALRISVDASNVNGQYATGQEILIRCNGFAIGRYADQPQLCVPSYNNNINAQNANQKMGWAPGRIPFPRFVAATTRIGLPDMSKIVVDTITIDMIDAIDRSLTSKAHHTIRQLDGKLVCLKNVHFTGEYENNGNFNPCTTGDPATDGNANVFAPTTDNIGYPQSRVISDGNKHFLVATSEYAKYARYYLPDSKYVGTVTGILGYYADNATSLAKYGADLYDWSITLRGACGYGTINDLDFSGWQPEEWHK